MLDRLGKLLDPDEFEAALTGGGGRAALDPAIPAAYAAHRAQQQREQEEKRKARKRKPPAAEACGRRGRTAGSGPIPHHPWLDPAACGDPGHVPARQGVAVDGKERKGAKNRREQEGAPARRRHPRSRHGHRPGQGCESREGQRDQPLQAAARAAAARRDAVVTSDAMQANRDNSLFLRKVKDAHWLWPILGNQPNLNAN